jgi:hypothetical protein
MRRAPLWFWLLACALAIFIVASAASWNPLDLVVLDGFRGGWPIGTMLAAGLAGLLGFTALAAEDVSSPQSAWRIGLVSSVVLVFCGVKVTSFVVDISIRERRVPAAAAPDGRHEAVFYYWSDGSTSGTTVRLRSRAGLLSRESRTDLVCTPADDRQQPYRVEFVGDDRLRIFADGALLLDTTFSGHDMRPADVQDGC